MLRPPKIKEGIDAFKNPYSIEDVRLTGHCLIRYENDLADQISNFYTKTKNESKMEHYRNFANGSTDEDILKMKYRGVGDTLDRMCNRTKGFLFYDGLYKYQVKVLYEAFAMWEKNYAPLGTKTDSTHCMDAEHSKDSIVFYREKLQEFLENFNGKTLPIQIDPNTIIDEYYKKEREILLTQRINDVARFNMFKEKPEMLETPNDISTLEKYQILKYLLWSTEKEHLVILLVNMYNKLPKNCDIVERGWLYDALHTVIFLPIIDWRYNETTYKEFDYEKEKPVLRHWTNRNEFITIRYGIERLLPIIIEKEITQFGDKIHDNTKSILTHCWKILVHYG
jgi:hypothetical protein